MGTIKKLIRKYTDNSMDLIRIESEDYDEQLLEYTPTEEVKEEENSL
mgnify:FL=1